MEILFLIAGLVVGYYLSNERRTIMSAIDELRAAVENNATTAADGFAAIGSALQELATDIANLPQNSDVQAEAARLTEVTNTIASQTAAFSQQIRDAVPTPPTA